MKNTLCLYTDLCIEHRRYDFKNYIIILDNHQSHSDFPFYALERRTKYVFYAILRRPFHC
ncbi:Hypothetical predicted protein [Paramuricea clavata]|uniref:Uncharacterized protein n=1 Tax=Paramuricea clavata TaxID=317549 RepID=A0A6S7HS23_PARCT|nr:Hypothetical predicted protein [Paramuricea clavata]